LPPSSFGAAFLNCCHSFADLKGTKIAWVLALSTQRQVLKASIGATAEDAFVLAPQKGCAPVPQLPLPFTAKVEVR